MGTKCLKTIPGLGLEASRALQSGLETIHMSRDFLSITLNSRTATINWPTHFQNTGKLERTIICLRIKFFIHQHYSYHPVFHNLASHGLPRSPTILPLITQSLHTNATQYHHSLPPGQYHHLYPLQLNLTLEEYLGEVTHQIPTNTYNTLLH